MKNTGMNQILPLKEVGPVFCLHQERKSFECSFSVNFRNKFPVKKFRSVSSGFNRRGAVHG